MEPLQATAGHLTEQHSTAHQFSGNLWAFWGSRDTFHIKTNVFFDGFKMFFSFSTQNNAESFGNHLEFPFNNLVVSGSNTINIVKHQKQSINKSIHTKNKNNNNTQNIEQTSMKYATWTLDAIWTLECTNPR